MIVPFNAAGRKPPFYFIHGLIGLMPLGQFLATNLGEDQPLQVLHAEGMDGRADARFPRTALEMAELYADQIQQTGPSGPIVVGGMCKGALAAIEVAQALRNRGADIRAVILADPPAQAGRSASPGFSKHLEDPNFIAHLGKRVRAQLEIHAGFPYNTMPFDMNDAGSLDMAVRAGVRCMSALDIHMPKPYAGDVMAIMTPQRAPGFFQPNMYWMSSLADLRLTQVVPCNHLELFQSARHELVRALQYLLSQAFSERPAPDRNTLPDTHAFGDLDTFEPSRDMPITELFRKKARRLLGER